MPAIAAGGSGRTAPRWLEQPDLDLNSHNPGYGVPSNRILKSLVLFLRFLRFLLFSPQKATKRTKKEGIVSAFP
jgi:hypothetical protein